MGDILYISDRKPKVPIEGPTGSASSFDDLLKQAAEAAAKLEESIATPQKPTEIPGEEFVNFPPDSPCCDKEEPPAVIPVAAEKARGRSSLWDWLVAKGWR